MASRAVDDVTVSAPQMGKTATGQVWLMAEAWMHGADPRPWWWTAPTYAQARHGFRGIVDMARGAGILQAATSTVPLQAEFINGARLEARSWDRPEGMYGPSVLGLVVDEFGMLTAAAYQAISSRRAETIRQGFGRARYLGNVGPMDGTAHALWKLAEQGQSGFACRRWTWRDRMAADPCPCNLPIVLETAGAHRPDCPRRTYAEFIAREAARMSAPQFRALWEAEWLDWNELPVYEFDRAVHVKRDLVLQPQLAVELACDFNVDPMAWIVGQSHGGEVWALDEIAIEGGATTQDACNEFIRRYPDQKLAVDVYGDASGTARKTSASQTDYQIIRAILGGYYRQFRLCVPRINPAVVDRVNAVNALMRPTIGLSRYAVHERCKGLIEDYARVSWRPGTRDLDKSNKKLTHFSDAEGYRITSLHPVHVNREIFVATCTADAPLHDSIATLEF